MDHRDSGRAGRNDPPSGDSPVQDPYGALVERFADHIEVDYNGLEVDDVITRATANLGHGYGAILSGRVDPTKPHVPPHKTPWHAGHTGYNGRDAQADDLPKLIRNVVWRLAAGHERGILNLGARLPLGVIGCDVDAYGHKHGLTTLAQHEEKLGPLPPTYMVTARGYETGSGIRLYAVPESWRGVGELQGAHVELIQRHHRFIVAPGGLHHTGTTYRLYDGGVGAELKGGELPNRSDLPRLPEKWLDALYREASVRGPGPTSQDVADFAETYTFSERPNSLAKTVADVREATGEGWTRNAYHRALFVAARKARAGCYPWVTAVAAIEAAAIGAYRQRGTVFDASDFSRSVEHAVRQALAMDESELAVWGSEDGPRRLGRFAYRRQRGQHASRRTW